MWNSWEVFSDRRTQTQTQTERRTDGKVKIVVQILTSTIAFVSVIIKKIKERYKERKFHQNINVNLSEHQPYEGQLPGVNDVKNNVPIFNGFQIALVVGFVLANQITHLSLDYAFNDSKDFYKQYGFKQFTNVFTVACIKVRTASFPRFWKNHPQYRNK